MTRAHIERIRSIHTERIKASQDRGSAFDDSQDEYWSDLKVHAIVDKYCNDLTMSLVADMPSFALGDFNLSQENRPVNYLHQPFDKVSRL